MFKKFIFAFICILSFGNLSASPEIVEKDSPELTVEFCKKNKIYCAIVKLKPEIDSSLLWICQTLYISIVEDLK